MTQVKVFACPDCGPGVRVDEDGCCATCGADTDVEPATGNLSARVREAYAATLEATREDGGLLPTFVDWEELSMQDRAFLKNVCGALVEAERDRVAAWLREMLAKIETGLSET